MLNKIVFLLDVLLFIFRPKKEINMFIVNLFIIKYFISDHVIEEAFIPMKADSSYFRVHVLLGNFLKHRNNKS